MPDDWMQMTEEEILPYTKISMDIECDRALGSIHVDGIEIQCPMDRKICNQEEVNEWVRSLKVRSAAISESLKEFGLECSVMNILDKDRNPYGMVFHLQVRKLSSIKTVPLEGAPFPMHVPVWYKPTEWPSGNPDGDEFQKIVSAGCFPEIPPP